MILAKSTASVEASRSSAHVIKIPLAFAALNANEDWEDAYSAQYELHGGRAVPRAFPQETDFLHALFRGHRVAFVRDPLIGIFEIVIDADDIYLSAPHKTTAERNLSYASFVVPNQRGDLVMSTLRDIFAGRKLYVVSLDGSGRRPTESNYFSLPMAMDLVAYIIEGLLSTAAAQALTTVLDEADAAFED